MRSKRGVNEKSRKQKTVFLCFITTLKAQRLLTSLWIISPLKAFICAMRSKRGVNEKSRKQKTVFLCFITTLKAQRLLTSL